MVAMHCGGSMGKMMPGMRGGGPMMRGMMHMMGAPTPGMILQHRQRLSLSADQVSQLEAMQKQAQAACTKHMELAMATHNAANQMLEASSPDFAAYSAKMKEAAVHMAEGQVTMAKAAVEARNILTAAQRQTLKSLAEQMHKRP
jgi:Spy/CpxP family protein refolding chaperone